MLVGYFTVNNFLRHLVPFIPWLAIAASFSLVKLIAEAPRARRSHPAVVVLPVFLYLTVFVVDGERLYIDEPRNAAAD